MLIYAQFCDVKCKWTSEQAHVPFPPPPHTPASFDLLTNLSTHFRFNSLAHSLRSVIRFVVHTHIVLCIVVCTHSTLQHTHTHTVNRTYLTRNIHLNFKLDCISNCVLRNRWFLRICVESQKQFEWNECMWICGIMKCGRCSYNWKLFSAYLEAASARASTIQTHTRLRKREQ